MHRIFLALKSQADQLDLANLHKYADAIDDCLLALAAEQAQPHPTDNGKFDLENNKGILKKYNITAGAQIGKGGYAKVYNAILGSDKIALKITESLHEADNWNRIGKAIESAPAEIKRHFPKIYMVAKGKNDRGEAVAIVAMEKLVPLDASTRKALFSKHDPALNKDERNTSLENVLANKQVVENAAKYALGPDATKEEAGKLAGFVLAHHKADNPEALQNSLLIASQQYALSLSAAESGASLGAFEIFTISQGMFQYLDKVSHGGSFPHMVGSEDDQPWVQEIPEAKSVYAALKYIQAAGIVWQDVSYENIMMRPGTGDAVIIDVGMFYSEDQ